jgi:hypothetical protein
LWFTARKSAMIAAWLVVMLYRLHIVVWIAVAAS